MNACPSYSKPTHYDGQDVGSLRAPFKECTRLLGLRLRYICSSRSIRSLAPLYALPSERVRMLYVVQVRRMRNALIKTDPSLKFLGRCSLEVHEQVHPIGGARLLFSFGQLCVSNDRAAGGHVLTCCVNGGRYICIPPPV